MRRIIKDNLGMTPFTLKNRQKLTDLQKKKQLDNLKTFWIRLQLINLRKV